MRRATFSSSTGSGGIGKSTLSERFEAWANGELPLVNGWGSKPATAIDATARIDLRESAGQFDVVGALVAVRQQLGRLKKHWPSFDLAFAAYWSATRPGEVLPGSGTSSSGFADAVAETIENILNDLGALSTATGIGAIAVRRIVTEIRRRQLRTLAFESYDGYPRLLERCANEPSPSDPRIELLGELAALLSYELSIWKDGRVPLLVVFVDHFECLGDDPRHLGERRLNQFVWSMPNVLFVVTGRNLVDWYEDNRTTLYSCGPAAWPQLAPNASDDPRQHLVGRLSGPDRLKVIRLGRELLDLPLPDLVIQELADASGGLPQYLTLALEIAATIKRNGRGEVTMADITGSLGRLVENVLNDVPADEQRAIRAAALFPYFDTGLIAAAAGVDHGCAERAVRRPVIDSDDSAAYPFHMHDEIRAAIRAADHRIAGGWSSADWLAAGTRALREARTRYQKASEAGEGAASLRALSLAIGIVCDQDVEIAREDGSVYRDWLSKAIVYGPSFSGLRPLIPAISATDYGQHVLDFILAKTVELPVDERCQLLRSIFDSGHPLSFPAGRHLAYTLRNVGRWDDALLVFDELVARNPVQLHLYQRGLTLASSRRFADATAALEGLDEFRRETLRMTIDASHGQSDEWMDSRPASLERLRKAGRQRELIENTGSLLRWRSLVRGDTRLAELESLRDAAEAVGYDTGVRDFMAAIAFTRLEFGGEIRVEELEILDRARNGGELGFRSAMVAVSQAFALDDRERLLEYHAEIERKTIPRGRTWIATECLLDSLGMPLTVAPTQWLHPYDEVRDRWRGIFDRWKDRINA